MPYVSRIDGVVNGTYANEQPGYAEEYLPDDNPEVVVYLNPPPPPPTADLQAALLFDHENRIRAQEGAPPLTLGDFLIKVKS